MKIGWKTEDVGYVVHTKEEWLVVFNEAFNHKKTQLGRFNGLKMAVQGAAKHQDIIHIVW